MESRNGGGGREVKDSQSLKGTQVTVIKGQGKGEREEWRWVGKGKRNGEKRKMGRGLQSVRNISHNIVEGGEKGFGRGGSGRKEGAREEEERENRE